MPKPPQTNLNFTPNLHTNFTANTSRPKCYPNSTPTSLQTHPKFTPTSPQLHPNFTPSLPQFYPNFPRIHPSKLCKTHTKIHEVSQCTDWTHPSPKTTHFPQFSIPPLLPSFPSSSSPKIQLSLSLSPSNFISSSSSLESVNKALLHLASLSSVFSTRALKPLSIALPILALLSLGRRG